MSFLSRRKERKELKKHGMVPLTDLTPEDVKCELSDMLRNAGPLFAVIASAVGEHFEALPEDVIEDLLEDTLYFHDKLAKVAATVRSDHYTISYMYALLYHVYGLNNALSVEEAWLDLIRSMQATVGVRMTTKKCGSSTDGYA